MGKAKVWLIVAAVLVLVGAVIFLTAIIPIGALLHNTNTGNIDIPKSTVGGRCKIETDTGNIRVSFAK